MCKQEIQTNQLKQPGAVQSALKIKDKLRQKTVMDFIEGINWETSSDSPFVVEFDPTTNCNLACPDCISGSLLNQGQFDRQRIRDLTKEMIDAGVKAVVLIGGGEPMMHPEIGWVIEQLGQAGLHIGITTNGLYLKKHLEVTAKYASWVRVSMDAGSAETFQRIRPSRSGKSMFEQAISNMREFAKIKQGRLGYSFMVFSQGDYGFNASPDILKKTEHLNNIQTNVHEIYQAAQLAKEIGCEYFEVKPMYDVNHYSVMQKQHIAQIVEQEIDKAKSLEDNNFLVLEALKLRDSLRGGSNLEPKEYTKCAISQLRTLVTPSGVYVCPYFRGVESKKIGDVHHQSFKEMWHGSQRKKVMHKLNPSVDCRMHCIRHDSNLTLERMIANEYELPVVPDYDLFI